MQLDFAPATPNAADKRIAEILASVRNTFAEKGFDGASMQDLARAAGMSVGNFYRYFPSKADIVSQLISVDLDQMSEEFGAAMMADDPLQALRENVAMKLKRHQDCSDGQLWAEITASALRKPEIGVAAHQMESVIVGHLTKIFAASTGLSIEEAGERFGVKARFMILLFKSASMMAPEPGKARDDLNELILRTINQTLDDVASASVKV
jgi:AcrR family transcriptional regulator